MLVQKGKVGKQFLNCVKVFTVSRSGSSYNWSETLMQIINSRVTIKVIFV